MLAEGNKTIVAVHSYKGGTGKTLLSANLATLFAAQGRKTCLLDMDFYAPSLHSLFKTDQPRYWLNDYMNGACDPDRILQNVCSGGLEKDKLFVGLANPSVEAIEEMSVKDRKWEMQALFRLFSFRDSLFNGLGFDYLILDTSPGLRYSSINAVVTADIALIVTTLDGSDMDGTRRMLNDLYGHFDKKTVVILNKVPSGLCQWERIRRLQSDFGSVELVFNSEIACFCDIPLSENPCFFACEKQSHLFSRAVEKIAFRIAAYQS